MTTRLRFWGTRGSLPTPGPATCRYGGNTPCISLERDRGPLIVLDAGTGLRVLGDHLMRSGRTAVDVALLLSHTHWDHIQGLPFFKPLSDRSSRLIIYGASQDRVPLEEILRHQMDPMVFPVPMAAMGATIHIREIEVGPVPVDGVEVSALRLRHPGTTLGFRVCPRDGGREVAYMTDNELGPAAPWEPLERWYERCLEWLAGVDTLIHDAMYTDRIAGARTGWGHSTGLQAVDLAADAGCRRLVLFHHDPELDDDALDALHADVRAYARRRAPALEVLAAVEGMEVEL